jgi:hypothetical protein
MKRLLLLIFLPLSAWSTTRTVSINAPATAVAGHTISISTAASTDATDSERIGFYHVEFSTNGGASWAAFCYDMDAGKSATRTLACSAAGVATTILVRVRVAFRGGTAGDVAFDGSPIDWGGTWDTWRSPVPTRYASIAVVASPGGEPAAGNANDGLRVLPDEPADTYVLSWWGRSGKTYFVQSSDDLVHWNYWQLALNGSDAVLYGHFSTNSQKLFLRTRSLAGGAGDPLAADSDTDGLTNAQEFAAGTDPLLTDSDGDGIPDGWELAHGFDPRNDADINADSDFDGVSNLREALLGLDRFHDDRGSPASLSVTLTNGTLRNITVSTLEMAP